MSRPVVLEAAGLRVVRGGVEVLDVPAFRLREHERVAVVGPNGSGKSTLLLALMGLLPRAAGEVRFRGEPVDGAGPALARRRRMAMVFQEPLLFDTTVRENVASGLRLRGLPRRECERRAGAALERLGLARLARRPARELSGGEARRVSLARALAVDPEVLLLDEPFASLDAPSRQTVSEDLLDAVRAAEVAAVLVTHDQAEALQWADRMVVLRAGRIVQEDAPAAVLNEPADPFVASFLGMDTVLEAVVAERAPPELTLRVAGQTIHAVGEVNAGDRVYVCLRPEDVTVDLAHPGGGTSARNVLRGTVAGIASAGLYLKVKLDCGFPLVASLTAESFARLGLARGAAVYASFKATAVRVVRRKD